MTDPTNDNDIDALLAALDWGPGALTNEEMLDRSHAALTALVAERDALRVEAQNAKTYWRERSERRDAEEKSAADRDLRERLVCAALTGVMAHPSTVGNPKYLAEIAVAHADAAIAAMRKGESDGT